jgi:uncharacterized membrane protein YccC
MDAAEGSSSKGYRRELKLHERERKAVMVSAEPASSSGRSPPCRRPSSGQTPPRARPSTKNPNHIIRAVAFVARCSGAATFAYLLAIWVGLPNSLWAAISALVVSQEQLSETQSSLAARILGTLIGICVAVAVNVVASYFAAGISMQIAIGVAICSLVARERPALRVCMWTCLIVLLTEPSVPIAMVALHRGSEVILGALLGGAFHFAAEVALSALTHASGEPPLDDKTPRQNGNSLPTCSSEPSRPEHRKIE